MVVVVVVVVMLGCPGPGQAPDVPHEGLVVRPGVGVVSLPAAVTEVVEADLLPAEVRPLLHGTDAAQGVLQVGVNLHSRANLKLQYKENSSNLNFLAESRGLDLNEGGGHGLHVAGLVVEGHAARTDGILVLVSVQAGVDNTFIQGDLSPDHFNIYRP